MKKRKLFLSVVALALFTLTSVFSLSANGKISDDDIEGCCIDFGDFCLLPIGGIANFDEC